MGDKELPENEIQPYKELGQEFGPSPFWVWPLRARHLKFSALQGAHDKDKRENLPDSIRMEPSLIVDWAGFEPKRRQVHQ